MQTESDSKFCSGINKNHLNIAKRSMKGYLREIAEVPSALEELCHHTLIDNTIDKIACRISKSKNIMIFGMASSFWASLPFVYGLNHLNLNVKSITAYDGLHIPHSLFNKESIVILISQSGMTIEIKELINRIKKIDRRPYIIGITNYENSFLFENSDYQFKMYAGEEYHAPTKTYINTIAILLILYFSILKICKNESFDIISDILNISSKIRINLCLWEEWGKSTAKKWNSMGRTPIQFLAFGPQMASAWQASMLCSETAKSFSAVLDWATFRHGFEPQVWKKFFALGFRPTKKGIDIWNTTMKSIDKRGGTVIEVPTFCKIESAQFKEECYSNSSMLSPLWETIPIHWLCIEMAKFKNIDPSQIERKVTVTLE